MQTEIEAKFLDIDHNYIRYRLNDLGAKLKSKNYLTEISCHGLRVL